MAKINFSETEREAISQAIEKAESKTSGEIVPVILNASDHYPGARWRVATSVALLLGLITMLAVPDLSGLYLLVALCLYVFLGHLLATQAQVLRLALSQSEIDEEVQQKAYESFMQLNLHRTKDRTGILIFVSMLEHRIMVIADSGINDEAPENYWQDVVAVLSARIRSGDLANGLCEAITLCGELLAEKFPISEDDQNELKNTVILEEDL